MSRYGDIRDGLARDVAAGRLRPGDELPSIRALAARAGTTPATAARALRDLHRTGVLVTADRRRARVASRGDVAAQRLLRGGSVFRLAGSDDPALAIVLAACGDAVGLVGKRGSFPGLTALWRGEADGAAIHLLHRSGAYNRPYARALLRGRDPALVRLWRREQGLLLPAGSPVESVAELAHVRTARREQGSGTRVLLDRLLIAAGVDPDAVRGPEHRSHFEVALAVAAGVADAGVGVRAAASALGLAFVPLAWEDYDVVLPGGELGGAAPLVAALENPAVRMAVAALGGYDVAHAGTVERLREPRSRPPTGEPAPTLT